MEQFVSLYQTQDYGTLLARGDPVSHHATSSSGRAMGDGQRGDVGCSSVTVIVTVIE